MQWTTVGGFRHSQYQEADQTICLPSFSWLLSWATLQSESWTADGQIWWQLNGLTESNTTSFYQRCIWDRIPENVQKSQTRDFICWLAGSGCCAFSLNVDFLPLQEWGFGEQTHQQELYPWQVWIYHSTYATSQRTWYLKIIPPPNEPHLTDVNHYLRPLVNNMLDSWDRVIWFSHATLHPEGCMTNSAVVVAVIDLLATCKASGLVGQKSHIHRVGQNLHEVWDSMVRALVLTILGPFSSAGCWFDALYYRGIGPYSFSWSSRPNNDTGISTRTTYQGIHAQLYTC